MIRKYCIRQAGLLCLVSLIMILTNMIGYQMPLKDSIAGILLLSAIALFGPDGKPCNEPVCTAAFHAVRIHDRIAFGMSHFAGEGCGDSNYLADTVYGSGYCAWRFCGNFIG